MSEPAARRIIHVVAGVLSDADGRVLLADRPAGKHLAGGWEFPGGKLDPGEEPLAALRRELREEIGIDVVAAEPLVKVSHDYPDRSILLDVWRVTRYAGEPASREGQSLRWCALAELPAANLLAADLPVVEVLLGGVDRNSETLIPDTSGPV